MHGVVIQFLGRVTCATGQSSLSELISYVCTLLKANSITQTVSVLNIRGHPARFCIYHMFIFNKNEGAAIYGTKEGGQFFSHPDLGG